MSTPKPWISIYDQYGDPTGEIRGNKEGLQALKNVIDATLKDGECRIPTDLQADFESVQLSDGEPKAHTQDEPNPITKFGCLALASVVIFVFLLGVYRLYEILLV